MAKRGRKPGSGQENAGRTNRRKPPADGPPLTDYRHAATRKNNPPAKIAAEGTVPVIPKAQYAYNPHLPPVLRFDAAGGPDRLPELLAKARTAPLTDEEARLLADALRTQEPWLEWTGKREKKWFEVDPVALHIHERVSTQAILKIAARQDVQRSLFADPEQEYHEAVQFYRHDVDWANRLILGDSLQVMSSLARREDLAGKVQFVYIDPPYGIKFASNFQPEVGRRDVKDKEQDLTREPEMVRAYRDTWHLGIHSYLSYLRERLIIARELLADTGSIFVQIGDENSHRVRTVLDEVFGADNFQSIITFRTSVALKSVGLGGITDFVLWYSRDREKMKRNDLFTDRESGEGGIYTNVEEAFGHRRTMTADEKDDPSQIPEAVRIFGTDNLVSTGYTSTCIFDVDFEGEMYSPTSGKSWKTNPSGMSRLVSARRVNASGKTLRAMMYIDDYPVFKLSNLWTDVKGETDKQYVVQTSTKVVQRCMLMTTDPGDLVLDPTCGSGTTASVAEQWGRRWITIDTSRVAVAIARQRLLTAKFDMYALRPLTGEDTARNPDGTWLREPGDPKSQPRTFQCKSVPHITLKSIAQNVALDPIFERHEPILEMALAGCNAPLRKVSDAVRTKLCAKLAAKAAAEGVRAVSDADGRRWLLPGTAAKTLRTALEDAFASAKRNLTPAQKRSFEGRIPPEAEWRHWEVPFDADDDWPAPVRDAVTAYRKAWRAKMDEVNACIASSAEHEELVDQPEVIRGVTRVSGPFTVEAVQPPEMALGDNIDAHTGDQSRARKEADAGEGLFAGEPDALPEGFEARTLRMIEPRNDLEVANVTAYLEQMFRYLKADGVRFLNNKQAQWTRFEPLFESGRADIFHAEGRWTADQGHGKDQSDDGPNNVAVVFGPQYGPITAALVEAAIRASIRKGYEHLLLAGFAFDGAATGVLSEADEEGGVFRGRGGHLLRVHFAHVRPDINPGMNGLLKESPQPGAGQLFSVFGLPRVTVTEQKSGDGRREYVVEMEGVDIYNPVDNSIASTGAEKVAAWFLDSDYDGRTFCITQAFFPDRSAWDKLARALNGKDGPIDADRFEAFSGTTSLPFPAGKHGSVAVKVIDPRGNEVMTVERVS